MKQKRVTGWCLIITMLFFLVPDNYSYAKEDTVAVIDSSEASAIASELMTEATEDIEEYTEKDVRPMYDEDNQVAAFMVDFADEDESLGYAIVNKDGQIVEYSYDEGNFIEEMEEKVCNKRQDGKLYYIEPLNYYIETRDAGKNKSYYNAATAKEVKDIETVNTDSNDDRKCGNPSDNGEFITNPFACEDWNITSHTTYDVPGTVSWVNGVKTYKNFYRMSEFRSGQVCVPAAVTNLFFHYYRNYSKCSSLKDGTWKNVFTILYNKMGTDPEHGTLTSKVAGGIEWYCKTRKPKISCTAKTVKGTNSGDKVVAELKKRRPCILHVYDHNTYDDHALLALGYETFTSKKGNSTKKNNYIRVNDGWTQQSNRYVWGGCSGSWDYTSVSISTK